MAAAATERCRVWPKTAAQSVKCLRTHCCGAGSSRHPAIFPVVFGELIASHEPTEIPQSSAISRTVSLLLLQMIFLTLAIISSFLDVDSRPERRSLSTEVLPSLNRRNQSNTCVGATASSPNACCNNWYVSVAVFQTLKRNLIQMRCSVLSHIVKSLWHKSKCYFRDLLQTTEQTPPLATCVMSFYDMYEHVKTGCKHIPPGEQPLQLQSGYFLNKPRIYLLSLL